MSAVETIDLADPAARARWQEFVQSRPDTHCTDLAEWRLLFRELYGIRSHDWLATQGREVRGAMSLYHIRSPLLGRMLVTSPFFGYGGLYWDDEAVRDALLGRAEELGRALGVDWIEFRLREALPQPYAAHTDFLEFDVDLPPTAEEAWSKTLDPNARQNVRKSREHGLDFRMSADHGPCYELLCRTLRAHGTPFHGRRFFELLDRHLGERVRYTEVRRAGDLVAAGVVVRFRDGILTPYIGSLERSRHTRANYRQYWGIIEWACGAGIRRFELGRSPRGSRHEQFKRKWRPRELPVHYSYRALGRKRYRSVSRPSRVQLAAAGVWRYLPLGFTRRVGPLLFRYIP